MTRSEEDTKSQQNEEDDANVEEQSTRTNQEKEENEEGEEQHDQRSKGLDCVNVCTLLRRHFLLSKRLRCTRTQIVVLWLEVERALRNKITCYTTC